MTWACPLKSYSHSIAVCKSTSVPTELSVSMQFIFHMGLHIFYRFQTLCLDEMLLKSPASPMAITDDHLAVSKPIEFLRRLGKRKLIQLCRIAVV